jgi:hypothetical protein
MSAQHLHLPTSSTESPRSRRPLLIAALMVAFIGAFFVVRKHWAHVAGYWPYLFLLACPVMHLFRGHGGHGSHAGQGKPSDRPTTSNE